LSLDKGIWGKPLTDDGVKLMEIKTVECMPPWLSAALDKCCITPVHFQNTAPHIPIRFRKIQRKKKR
ncbi:MAG: hypothetical protein PHW77_09515, partial [Eubacteriales bacterium]|nr:hypothetical protein [Eubacteriales bacterium]